MTYLGYDVLEVTHNMGEAIAEAFGRQGELLENPAGRRAFDDHAGIPLPQRSFSWFAPDREAVVALRAFLVARKGRLTPFWTPTFAWDLVLAANALAAHTQITVRRTGYGQFLYSSPARRHLAIVPPGGPRLARKVTGLTDPGNGTEILQLDSAHGVDLSAAGTVISFLVLCRLAEDLTRIRWWGTDGAEADLTFQELPREVPA